MSDVYVQKPEEHRSNDSHRLADEPLRRHNGWRKPSRKEPKAPFRWGEAVAGAFCGLLIGVVAGNAPLASKQDHPTPKLPLPQSGSRLYFKLGQDAVVTCVGKYPTVFFIAQGVLQTLPAGSFLLTDPNGQQIELSTLLNGENGSVAKVVTPDLRSVCLP